MIYSRRMVRDVKRMKTAQKNGKMGGNPALCKSDGKSTSDNPNDYPPDNTHKPRSQEAKSPRNTPHSPPKGGGRGRFSNSKGGYAAAGRALAAIGDAPEQPQEGFDDRKRA
jgi:hypothetical protein